MKRTPLRRRTPLRAVGKKGRRDRGQLDAARLALKERSGGYCEARCAALCTGVGVHAHHIWPSDRDRGVHDPARMLWVCALCHAAIHLQPERSYAQGFLGRAS